MGGIDTIDMSSFCDRPAKFYDLITLAALPGLARNLILISSQNKDIGKDEQSKFRMMFFKHSSRHNRNSLILIQRLKYSTESTDEQFINDRRAGA